MGMAASQARYLALTARKTNTEYEGQQINQARTALANQSANLFNRLLELDVPVAPKKTDYTELQYSFQDGENESVIDSWEQLSTADPNYNYIVNHYYFTNVYTGAQRLLQDPQVSSKLEAKKEVVNARVPAPTVEYQTDADGNTVSVTIDGANGKKQIYLPVGQLTTDKKLENSLKDLQAADAIEYLNGEYPTGDEVYGWLDESTGTWHFLLKEDVQKMEPVDYTTVYQPGFIGNCELTELTNLTEAQKAELAQILRDCPNSSMNKYLSFDENQKLKYNDSGIYSFQMNGVTYYTTKQDLDNSMATHDNYLRPIDDQEKLAYYNAEQVRKRIEESNKALLETDGNGRFKSVKFDDNSIVYALNTETVTDDEAYQDAMNQYNYKVQQYEKTIADINARTSIIQQQDRTLELRLKQLDTEQNALSTEMEAVKKVIKDNVESTFKTFSD